MPNKSERSEARRAQIAQAALELFFERGYEGASIRMIQQKLGKEVGLFYYYFKSKDAVFEAAIELFFADYEKKMREIVDAGKAQPSQTLTKYIDYIDKATQDFREQYLRKLHWSVLGSIREHTMLIMKKYIREILELYVENGLLAYPSAGMEITVNLLAFGVGGSILYQSGEEYEQQRSEVKKILTQLLGLSDEL